MACSKLLCDPSNKTKENTKEETNLTEFYKSLFHVVSTVKSHKKTIRKLNKKQNQVIKKGLIGPKSQEVLANLYEIAEQEANVEENMIRKLLDKIYEVRNIRHQKIKTLLQSQRSSSFLKCLQISALRLPVWFPTNDEKPPPLCGAIEPHPSYVAKCGDLVAALVTQSGEERWIIAEAVEFMNGKYKVEDIDVIETNRNFLLEKKNVIPLPLMRADPVTCPDAFFPCGDFVLAMYPQTTCFFKALVKNIPKTSYDRYEVLFEDDFNQYTIAMPVSQRFVVPFPKEEEN